MPLTRYLTDSIGWVRAAPLDEWNEPQGDPTVVAIQGRITYHSRVVTGMPGGELVNSAGDVLMRERPVPGSDKLRWDGTDHPVVALEELRSHSLRAYRAIFQ